MTCDEYEAWFAKTSGWSLDWMRKNGYHAVEAPGGGWQMTTWAPPLLTDGPEHARETVRP